MAADLAPTGTTSRVDFPEADGAPPEVARMTHEQKLAGLLLMLSPENAARILKDLDEAELEAVTTEMTRLTTLTQEAQQGILREFSSVAVEAASAIPGGTERAQNLLEQSVRLFRASDILGRVAPSRAPVAAMQQIIEMDPRHLFNLLRYEKVRTIALVTSYLPPEKASQLLSQMRPEVREQVVERLATMAPTSVAVAESISEVLRRKLGNPHSRAASRTGGVKFTAQVINALPKSTSKSILLALKERNPELSDAIHQKMFTFEELERLDPKTLQRILQVVDVHVLTVSLKTVGDKLKAKLLAAISRRAADNVREEIEVPRPAQAQRDPGRAGGNHRDRPSPRSRRGN